MAIEPGFLHSLKAACAIADGTNCQAPVGDADDLRESTPESETVVAGEQTSNADKIGSPEQSTEKSLRRSHWLDDLAMKREMRAEFGTQAKGGVQRTFRWTTRAIGLTPAEPTRFQPDGNDVSLFQLGCS